MNGLIVKFWNVYGIEKDMEKGTCHYRFYSKGFKTGKIDMMTDGTEQREFLYAEDCCGQMETILQNYNSFSCDDELHITTGISTSILEIAQIIQVLFKKINLEIDIVPNKSKDEVQKDARNLSDPYIRKWWTPKTNIVDGLSKVFDQIKLEYSMTVSFNGLGNEGRLGNQMFQYAFIRGMSKKYGYDFMIPHANSDRFDNYGLFDCFELEGCKTGEGHIQH